MIGVLGIPLICSGTEINSFKKIYFVEDFIILSFNLQLCIPKYSECAEKKIVQSDVEDHILIPEAPDNEDNDHYRTLSGKVCRK